MLFEDVELFETAVEVKACVVPRVTLPMDICVGPSVREVAVKYVNIDMRLRFA